MKKIAFIYWVMCLFSVEANAQKLWGDAVFGMTPNQVSQAYPQSLPLEGNVSGEYSFIPMNFIALGELPSIVRFKFWENKLYGVDWTLKSENSFEVNKSFYDELLDGMKREYSDSGLRKQYRAFEASETDRARLLNSHVEWLDTIVRIYSDSWSTKNGSEIKMSMSEVIRGGPVRIDIYTENGAALKQLKSQSAQLKQEMQAEVSRKNKKADEQRHSNFFDSFIGKDIKSLAIAVGAPTVTIPMPKGEVVYVWEKFAENYLLCKTSVFTRKNGAIYSWHWSGNYCLRND